jgi:CrcB protein
VPVRLGIALGGALGTALRLAALGPAALAVTGAPAGTILAVNLVGTIALAVLVVLADRSERWLARLPALGGGLVGAFTTFSAPALAVALVLDGVGAPGALAAGLALLVLGPLVAGVALRVSARILLERPAGTA